MLIEEQIAERRMRAKKEPFKIEAPARGILGDYQVHSAASRRSYRVALRGLSLFENYCSCPDFAVNTLGTCKHIEAVILHARRRFGARLEKARYRRDHASISLEYADPPRVRIALPAAVSPELQRLREEYFDPTGYLREQRLPRFAAALARLRSMEDRVVVYADALEWIEREMESAGGLAYEQEQLALLDRGREPLKNLLKVPLYPFQIRGVLFAACRGRTVLADDMGLGKTIQAIGAAELLARLRGISRVLVICPASVKHQWLQEIARFSERSALVVDGSPERRRQIYADTAFFKILNYELLMRDLDQVAALLPDLIILDEAQRIRNWETATAKTIKQLRSRYALVLTGTPLENKLEELYSVVQFVDGRRLGPMFRFLHEHRELDPRGKLVGYRQLDQVRDKLQPILLRRRRSEVLTDLPPRTDKIFRVPLTPEQSAPYADQQLVVSRLVHKLERQGWLSPLDQQRLLCAIQNMRMLCDSTFLFDKETHVSPKLEELRELLRELVLEEERKVVIFSEWEKMTSLVARLLEELELGYVSLHGGVPTRQRGKLISRFRDDPLVRAFLSTDAGGVGLNLQAASVVINIEPPWNPARLEQRIARVHRMGQARPVLVVHLLTEKSIEERVWETIRLKKALFSGLFDGTASEVSFEKLGRKPMMEALKELVADMPVPDAPEETPQQIKAPRPTAPGTPPAPAPVAAAGSEMPPVSNAAQTLGLLLDAGLRFLEGLAGPPAAAGPAAAGERMAVQAGPLRSGRKPKARPAPPMTIQETLETAIEELVKEDPVTRRPVLAVPLPPSLTAERIAGTLSALLTRLTSR